MGAPYGSLMSAELRMGGAFAANKAPAYRHNVGFGTAPRRPRSTSVSLAGKHTAHPDTAGRPRSTSVPLRRRPSSSGGKINGSVRRRA